MEIEKIKITDIIPAEYNPRQISDEEMQKLQNSIDEFGLVEPIVLNLENNKIVSGHQRFDAILNQAMVDGDFLEELYMIRLGGIGWVFTDTDLKIESEEHEKALNLALNKISGEWDPVKLADVIKDLEMKEFDIPLTGFDDIELEELDIDFNSEKEPIEVEEDDYDEPNDIEVTVKKGDIYKLGEHRLMCGDSTKEDDVLLLMNNKKADMVFTDPPYNVSIGSIDHPKFKQRKIKNDNMSTDDFIEFCTKFITILKNNCVSCIYLCAGQGEDGRIMFSIADKILHNSTTIIWAKDKFTLGRSKYHMQYEPIWFGWSENGKTFTDDRTLSNLWEFKRPKSSPLHPTMKPIELISKALRDNPHANSCLDLFGGSGSTLIACEQMNRSCYMMELDPKYCQVIINRWEDYTGEEAVKLN